MQRLEADAEDLGGARLVLARVLERQPDQPGLGFVDRHAGRQQHRRRRIVLLGVGQRRRQVRRLDQVAAGEDRRPLDHVAQLADVARPGVVLEQAHGVLVDALDRLAVARVELVQEGLDEERDVFLALAQRRQLDGEDVQAVVEILAQLAAADGFGRIDVGRGDDPHVDLLLLAAAEAPELALLQHPQQLDLRRRHHLGDLVQEQRAAMGELETALPAFHRAGERALLVAEDLALEQRLGDGRAVDGHERLGGALAQLMDRLRHHLLARPGLAPDQHRRRRRRRLLDDAIDLADGRGAADDPAEAAVLAQLTAQDADLAQRLLPLGGLLDQDLEAPRVDRLGEVVVGPFLDRLDRGLDRPLRGEQDDRDVAHLIAQAP